VIILDLGLPDMDGVDVIRGLRGWTAAPIIVLSGRTGSEDKVEALDAGADDDTSEVGLTPTEWNILEILVRHPGKLINQKQLLTDVWGRAYTDQFHYLREYLARLRRKLEPDPSRPRHLITEPGMGYRYQP